MKIQKGRVRIEANPTLDRFQNLIFSSGFKKYDGYTSIYTRKDDLEHFVAKKGRVALALLDNQIIIGFAVLDYPNEKERWARLGGNIVMELKAVEVLREKRNRGIARQLLTPLFSDVGLEEKIVYLNAYSWIWDFDYSGLSLRAYRNMLINLYSGFGFTASLTNEPNSCLKSENIFMVRTGKNVLLKVQKNFKWLRFGVSI
jgi:GNAT superfamily N-acetyltransferase